MQLKSFLVNKIQSWSQGVGDLQVASTILVVVESLDALSSEFWGLELHDGSTGRSAIGVSYLSLLDWSNSAEEISKVIVGGGKWHVTDVDGITLGAIRLNSLSESGVS